MREGKYEALHLISNLANSVRNVATAAIQHRIHHEFASGNLKVEEMSALQAEFNGVTDHLDLFIGKIDDMIYPGNTWSARKEAKNDS
tara:strand:+ start:220 stop:480 length:261 start_codon:yes stop_codon:yes gene_type:complete